MTSALHSLLGSHLRPPSPVHSHLLFPTLLSYLFCSPRLLLSSPFCHYLHFSRVAFQFCGSLILLPVFSYLSHSP